MKNLITGIALATAAVTATAATAPMGSVGQSMGATGGFFGPFKIFLGLSGLWSKKDVKVTTTMTTKYNAAYAYAADGTQLFSRGWDGGATQNLTGHAAPDPNVDQVHDITRIPADLSANGWPQTASRQFLYDGKVTGKWAVGQDANANGRNPVAADVVDRTAAIMSRAMFNPRLQGAPADKAYVAAADYKATAETVNKLDYSNWGIRVEAGVGYSIMDELTLFILLSYNWNLGEKDDKDAKNTAKDVSFETKGDDKTFKAANGTADLKAKLNLESFKWNASKLASGVQVTAKVEETFGIMGGLEWRPTEMIGLYAKAGVKRYALEVLYEGGDFAYPFTAAQYTDAYTKANNKFKGLISQDKKSRKVTATEWPFAFGGGIRIIFMGMHCINLGIEYATFDADLSVDSGKDDDDDKSNSNSNSNSNNNNNNNNESKGADLTLANPFTAIPGAAGDIKAAGTGTHQFAPTGDVVNTITTKVEVQDLTISAGYMLTL